MRLRSAIAGKRNRQYHWIAAGAVDEEGAFYFNPANPDCEFHVSAWREPVRHHRRAGSAQSAGPPAGKAIAGEDSVGARCGGGCVVCKERRNRPKFSPAQPSSRLILDRDTGAAAGGQAAMPLTRAFAERDWQVARNSDPNVMRLGTGQSLISGKNTGKIRRYSDTVSKLPGMLDFIPGAATFQGSSSAQKIGRVIRIAPRRPLSRRMGTQR
jgi:hypothetical protein